MLIIQSLKGSMLRFYCW